MGWGFGGRAGPLVQTGINAPVVPPVRVWRPGAFAALALELPMQSTQAWAYKSVDRSACWAVFSCRSPYGGGYVNASRDQPGMLGVGALRFALAIARIRVGRLVIRRITVRCVSPRHSLCSPLPSPLQSAVGQGG